jgi:integral membrane protein
MTLEPRAIDIPRIPGVLKLYQVMSVVTGSFLLLLVAEVIIKWGFGYELELGGAYGFIALTPVDTVQAVNLSTAILIVHGWLYVLYLFACFRLWSVMRWNLLTFAILASGGIIPVLSFFLEVIYAKRVRAYLVQRAASDALTAKGVAA